MYFETRLTSAPETSPEYAEVRSKFLEGRSREARDLAKAVGAELRKDGRLPTSEDLLLCIEISRACGRFREYHATARIGHQRAPDDGRLIIYQARSLSTRGRCLAGLRLMEASREKIAPAQEAEYRAEMASIYGMIGMEAVATDWSKWALEIGADDPVALYLLSSGASILRNWEAAIDYGRQAMALAPKWMRCRSLLVNDLLSLGNIDEAQELIDEGSRLELEDASFDSVQSLLPFALSRHDEARELLVSFLDRWEKSELAPVAQRILFVLHCETGEWDQATAILKEEMTAANLPKNAGEELSKLEQRLTDAAQRSDADHRFISLPIIAQRPSQCVPTTVVMATYPQGQTFDADQLYREMKGRDGTMLWRMREWLEERGWWVGCVKATREIIKACIDADVPLIGLLEGPFNSHVEVVCGYDERVGTVWIRDPSFWFPYSIAEEDCADRWRLSGGSLWVIISPENAKTFAIADEWREPIGENLQALLKGVVQGNREAAEIAFAQIPDESPAAFLRDSNGVRVVLTPRQVTEKMAEVAADPDADPVARFRSFLSTQTAERVDEVEALVKADEDTFGPFVRRYIALLKAKLNGDWQDAEVRCQRMLETASSLSILWDHHAEILAELGRREEALNALKFAIGISPLDSQLRESRNQLELNQQPYSERKAEAERVMEEDPEAPSAMWGRCRAYSDDPNGLLYEWALKTYLHFCPRDPSGHQILAEWYASQDRIDLAKKQLDEARALMGEDEIPLWEEDPSTDDTSSASPDALKNASDTSAGSSDEISELFATASRPLEAESAEAIAALKAKERAGELPWHQSAILIVLSINRVLATTLSDSERTKKVAEELPPSVQGPTPAVALAVAENVVVGALSHGAADAMREWIQNLVPDYPSFPQLWFNHAVLLEIGGRLEDAIRSYQEMCAQHPGMESAPFRMGMVRAGQGALLEGTQYLEATLETNPGLPGALETLAGLYEALERPDDYLATLERLYQKFPYSLDRLSQLAMAIGNSRGWGAADQTIDAAADLQPLQALHMLKGRAAIRDGRIPDGRAFLEHAGQDLEGLELDEAWLKARLDLAMAEQDEPSMLQLCEDGLQKWPEAAFLRNLRVDLLLRTNPEQAERVIEADIREKYADEQLIYQWLSTKDRPQKFARGVIESAEQDHQEELVLQFVNVFRAPAFHKVAPDFYKWAMKQFPHLEDIGDALAKTLYLDNRDREALKIAKALLAGDPDNPRWHDLMGFCLQDHKPKEALKYLRASFEKNQSSEILFRIARCEQLSGDVDQAVNTHRQVLQLNPLASASVTNLFLLEPDEPGLLDRAIAVLKTGGGLDDQYFHVAAVKLAEAANQQLPVEWIDGAERRYEIVQAEGGYRSEEKDLKSCIVAWFRHTGDREKMEWYGGRVRTLIARAVWPGTDWIPPDA